MIVPHRPHGTLSCKWGAPNLILESWMIKYTTRKQYSLLKYNNQLYAMFYWHENCP